MCLWHRAFVRGRVTKVGHGDVGHSPRLAGSVRVDVGRHARADQSIWLAMEYGDFECIEVRLYLEWKKCLLGAINADLAERLRRLTRNQILSGSVGSNPTVCVAILFNRVLHVLGCG